MQALKSIRYQHVRVLKRHASSIRKFIAKDSPSAQPKRPSLSLFEELFPEEAEKEATHPSAKESTIPRLPLPELDEVFEDYHDDLDGGTLAPQRVTRAAAADAFRQDQLAVLALQISCKSLDESDFRRIAPRGKHIKDWTGPGDILKGTSGLRGFGNVSVLI